ncbi:MAG: cytochrome c biogenesis heme-transporting ATPase CcmA [Woeseiaceae bacterium]
MADFPFSARNIVVFRGERCLIRNLTLEVSEGDVVHLVGPNGCGKTSLLRVLAGLVPPEQGEVLWDGQPVHACRAEFNQQLAWLGHHAGLKSDLTLAENLQFDNALRRRHDRVDLERIYETLGLTARLSVRAGALSAGQRRRAALARVLMSSASLWLLDEPLTNLDTDGRALVLDALAAHAKAGGRAIFAAHYDVDVPNVRVRRMEWQS